MAITDFKIDQDIWSNNLALFKTFAEDPQNGEDARLQLLQTNPNDLSVGSRTISVNQTKESLGTRLFRSTDEEISNNTVREVFLRTIASMFGGVKRIPQKIKDVMLLKKFDMTGRPLTAHRVRLVLKALDDYNKELKAKGKAFRQSAPFIGENAEKNEKISILAATLHKKVAPAMKESLNAMVNNPTVATKEAFLRNLNQTIMSNISEAFLETGQYNGLNSPDLECVANVREMLLRYMMRKNPELSKALFMTTKSDLDTIIENITNAPPADLGKQYAWVQDIQFIHDVDLILRPVDDKTINTVINEAQAPLDFSDKLALCEKHIKPFLNNLETLIPDDLRRDVTEREQRFLNDLRQLTQETKAAVPEQKAVYERLRTMLQDLKNLKISLSQNNTIDNRIRNIISTQLSREMGILDSVVMKDLRKDIVTELAAECLSTVNLDDETGQRFKKIFMEKLDTGLQEQGTAILPIIQNYMTGLGDNFNALKVDDGLQETHFTLLKNLEHCSDENAKRLQQNFYRSFMLSAVVTGLGVATTDTAEEAISKAKEQFATWLTKLSAEKLPVNGLTASLKPNKQEECKKYVTDFLTRTYMRGMKLGEFKNQEVQPENLMLTNPFPPIIIREHNHGEVLFNGTVLPEVPQNPNRYKDVHMVGFNENATIDSTYVQNDMSRIALGEMLETKFTDPKIRHCVASALSMTLGLPGSVETLLHPANGATDEQMIQIQDLTYGYAPLNENFEKGYMILPNGKKHTNDIHIDDNGTTTIRCTVTDKSMLKSLDNMGLPIPVLLTEVQISLTMEIPGNQSPDPNEVPIINISELEQKVIV